MRALKITVFILAFVALIFFPVYYFVTADGRAQEDYLKIVNSFEVVDVDGFAEKLENEESFFVFVGWSKCPHCQKFAPKLKNANKDVDADIVYVSTDDLTAADRDILVSNLSSKILPYFAYYRDGQLYDVYEIEDAFTEEEIKTHLNEVLAIVQTNSALSNLTGEDIVEFKNHITNYSSDN